MNFIPKWSPLVSIKHPAMFSIDPFSSAGSIPKSFDFDVIKQKIFDFDFGRFCQNIFLRFRSILRFWLPQKYGLFVV